MGERVGNTLRARGVSAYYTCSQQAYGNDEGETKMLQYVNVQM